MPEEKEHWGSSLGFVLAMAGSAIGLGNIWRFSFVAGENGGGAFLLVYLLCALLVGLPVLICELAMGRASQANALRTFASLGHTRSALSSFLGVAAIIASVGLLAAGQWLLAALLALGGASLLRFGWPALGFLYGIVVPFFILCYYNVVGGWLLVYIWKSLTGQLGVTTAAEASAVMEPVIMAPKGAWFAPLFATLLFMAAHAAIIWRGSQKGIERCAKLLMPVLAVLMVALIVRELALPGALKGVRFLLMPDFSRLTHKSVIAALGHSFYSLSLGMGISITYGSYLRKDTNLPRSAFVVTILDTLASIMAGLAIFPVVFAMGLAPDSGPSLIFKVLPLAFQKMPLSHLWDLLFFLSVFIAALTSAISLLESPACILCQEFRLSRSKALLILVPVMVAISSCIALSSGDYSNLPRLGDFLTRSFGCNGGSLFDAFDTVLGSWMCPLAALLVVLFAGWTWGTRNAVAEMRQGSSGMLDTNFWLLSSGLYDAGANFGRPGLFAPCVLWGFFLRWVSPVLIILAFLNGLGVI